MFVTKTITHYVRTACTRNTSTRTVAFICFFSFLFSAFALSLVAAIMQGFEDVTYQLFAKAHPDIIIPLHTHTPSQEHITHHIATTASAPSSWHIFPLAHAYGVCLDARGLPQTLSIEAWDPSQDPRMATLSYTHTTKTARCFELTQENTCMIGTTLAHKLGMTAGDTITVSYMPKYADRAHIFHSDMTVIDTFHTGVEEYDATALVCSFATYEDLFDTDEIEAFGLNISPSNRVDALCAHLKQSLDTSVHTWRAWYPSLMEVMRLEKYIGIAIFSLVCLVACSNLTSLLVILIERHKHTIALMRTLGARRRDLRIIFISIGCTIAGTAHTIGIALAWVSSILITRTQAIPLPDAYMVDYVPAHMDWHIAALVFCITNGVGLMASYIGTRGLNHMDIAHVLKHRM